MREVCSYFESVWNHGAIIFATFFALLKTVCVCADARVVPRSWIDFKDNRKWRRIGVVWCIAPTYTNRFSCLIFVCVELTNVMFKSISKETCLQENCKTNTFRGNLEKSWQMLFSGKSLMHFSSDLIISSLASRLVWLSYERW